MNNNFEKLTDQVVSLLNNPTKWEKPWILVNDLAYNAYSNRMYEFFGWNQIVLSHQILDKNFRFNRWITFNQVQKAGGKLKKGEKCTFIYFTDHFFTLAETGNKIDKKDVQGYREDGVKLKSVPFLKCFPVFNIDQAEGLPEEYFEPQQPSFTSTIEGAETLLKAFEHLVSYKEVNKAFYSPVTDSITAPFKNNFKDMEGYYLTIFHEIAHLSGHSSRLNREMGGRKEDSKYAFEELVAELTATFLGGYFGIENKIEKSAKYINSWLSALENDTRFIYKAMKHAKEATSWILNQAGISLEKEEQKDVAQNDTWLVS